MVFVIGVVFCKYITTLRSSLTSSCLFSCVVCGSAKQSGEFANLLHLSVPGIIVSLVAAVYTYVIIKFISFLSGFNGDSFF